MINKEYPFDPFFLFKSSMGQTLMGWLLNIPIVPRSRTKLVTLPDEDKLALEVTTPKLWQPNDLTVVMIHGLCGSHRSVALARMTKKLSRKKIRAIRMNLRGCGTGRGLARSTYHCGRSEDIVEALKVLKEEFPDSPIILIGFSLGGNIVLKMAGELKEKAMDYIDKVIALSPPIDLSVSIKLFEDPVNKVYLRYFTKLLRQDIEYLKHKFSDFPDVNFPKHMTMTDFNNLFIVPFFGFESLDEYYRLCSSKYVISDIKVPCKVLLSEDDPLVSWQSFDEVEVPQNMEVYVTKNGGHLGYLGSPKDKRGFYWLDSLLLDWIVN